MHQRRLNVKLLVCLIVGLVVLVGGVYGLHEVQVRRNADILLRQAKAAQEQDKLQDAANYYRRYVNLVKDDDEAYIEWATVLADRAELDDASLRDRAMAYNTIHNALRRAPENEVIRKRLAEYSLQPGWYRPTDALEYSQQLADERPEDPELQALYVRALLASKEYNRAVDKCYELIGYSPAEAKFSDSAIGAAHIDTYMMLASTLRMHLESPQVADQMIDRMVNRNPNDARAHWQRARYLATQDKLDEARADLQKALQLAPTDADVIVSAAELAIMQDELAFARKHLEAGVKHHPKDERIYRTLASLEMKHGNAEAAMKHVNQGLELLPDSAGLLLFRVELQLGEGDEAAARKSIDAMRTAGLRQEYLDYLQSRVMMLEGRWIDAERELERIRGVAAEWGEIAWRVNMYLGQCQENLGMYDKALTSYKASLSTDAAASLSEAALAIARSGIERMERRLTIMPPDPVATTDVEVDATEAFDPAEIDRLVQAHLDRGSIEPEQAKMLKAELLLDRRQWELVLPVLEEASRDNPKDVRVWVAIYNLMLNHPKFGLEAAGKALETARGHVGETLEWRALQAEFLARQGGENLRERMRALEQGADQYSPGDRARFWNYMGNAYLRARLVDDVRRCWRNVAEANPNNLDIRMQLFDLAANEADDAAMRKALDEIHALVGSKEDSNWKFAEAARLVKLVEKGQIGPESLDRAQQLVNEALATRPQWASLHRLLGEIYVRKDNLNAAIEAYKDALNLGDRSAKTVQYLARLYTIKGDFKSAEETLARLKSETGSEALRDLDQYLAVRRGDLQEAMELARQAAEEAPNDPSKLITYGQLLYRDGQKKEAEAQIRKAVEATPQDAKTWLVLVGLLTSTDQPEAAEAEIRKAQLHVPEEQLPLFLASCHQMLGNIEEAESHYLAAYEAKPSDTGMQRNMAAFYLGDRYKSADKFSKAKSYLDRILSSREAEEKPPHANVVWARRATAQLLARGGGYQDLRDALIMIDANAVDGRLSSEDKLLKATLYSQRPEPVSRRNAIRLLEEVKVGRGLSASSHLTLAELYRQMNDWEKARQQMVELLTRNPESPTILVRYTSMLVQRGDLDAAERRLRELKKLVPDDPRAIELEARLLAKRNQMPDAVAMVMKLVPANPEVKDLSTIAQVAVLLEQIGAHNEAEKYYRLYYQMDPRAQLVLAGFLGRHGTLQRGGTLEEAFRFMDQAIGKFDLNQVIAVGISTIRQRKAEVGDRFDHTVDGWIEKARRENPDAARPLLSLAEFRDLQENYSEVEQLYKQLLTHKDLTGQGRALVLNNLAYVMAMQGRDAQQALAYIKEAVDILGPSTELLDTRAMANLAAGDHQSAISDLNLALSASPSELKHFHLALANMAAGNDEAARDALQKAQGMGLKESTLSGLERIKYEKLVAWLAQIGQTARN